MLGERRRRYAAEIASTAGLKTPGLEEALASVPRERFFHRDRGLSLLSVSRRGA